jgi:hypothetical protein
VDLVDEMGILLLSRLILSGKDMDLNLLLLGELGEFVEFNMKFLVVR